MTHSDFLLDDFEGICRLFPLPNLVVFPKVVQPLHIFEPRYVEMLEEATRTDSLIATALLLPGWEAEYDGRPPIDPIVCVGRIISHAPAPEPNRYNVLLAGVSRAEVVRELPAQRSFREAEISLLPDFEADIPQALEATLRASLISSFYRIIGKHHALSGQLQELFREELPLSTLTDLIAYSLPLELVVKQALLSENSVLQRSRVLDDHLRAAAAEPCEQDRPFPPDFSLN